jgi:ribosomal protein S12 methylthiotransferase accessory factor
MSRTELAEPWYASPYTGLFADSGPVPRAAHDPDVEIWSGVAPLPGPGGEPPASGGAGWDAAAAEAAGVGEAIERWQTWPLPCDGAVEARFSAWPLDEPAVAPERWVLFHPEQYGLPGFPYRPFTRDTVCRWVCFRQAFSGLPHWVPEELAYLTLPPGRDAQLCPLVSTGLASGRWEQAVLLRGLQESIERDAVVGAAWGRYALEEHPAQRVFASLAPAVAERLLRPNLRYHFYRIATPFSAHVSVVTLEGEDLPGPCFSAGSACRQTRTASWLKALLEAVQGRHFVRYLLGEYRQKRVELVIPASFAEHAVYYSLHPERLTESVLGYVVPAGVDGEADRVEDMADLVQRLGPDRPVLFRNLTPPGLAIEQLGWLVVRVLVPGLQPLHGHHELPLLGGPLWQPRGWREWADMPPHPYP